MTPRQTAYYWRLWGRLARKHGLGKRDFEAPSLTPLRAVQNVAREMSGMGTPSADHWRHACHIYALGRTKSSRDLSSDEFDRVIATFQVLVDPSDMDAQERLLDPDIQKRRKLVWLVKQAGQTEAYIDTVARRKFGTRYCAPYWEDLPMEDLRQLAMTIKAAAKRKAAA